MSREFGEDHGGYFHSKINNAAEDALHGDEPLTRLWGEFLREFFHVAYAISSVEACDSQASRAIIETINRLPALQQRLDAVSAYVKPFQEVAEAAIRDKTKEIQ